MGVVYDGTEAMQTYSNRHNQRHFELQHTIYTTASTTQSGGGRNKLTCTLMYMRKVHYDIQGRPRTQVCLQKEELGKAYKEAYKTESKTTQCKRV